MEFLPISMIFSTDVYAQTNGSSSSSSINGFNSSNQSSSQYGQPQTAPPVAPAPPPPPFNAGKANWLLLQCSQSQLKTCITINHFKFQIKQWKSWFCYKRFSSTATSVTISTKCSTQYWVCSTTTATSTRRIESRTRCNGYELIGCATTTSQA